MEVSKVMAVRRESSPGSGYESRRPRARACLCVGLFLSAVAVGCVGDDAPDDEPSGAAGISGNRSRAGSSAAAGSGGSGGNAACTKAGGDSKLPAAGSKDSHFPVIPGSTWTYHHENPTKAPWDEFASLEATTYMGCDAFLLQDEEDAQGEKTRSTLIVDGTKVYRAYREIAVGGMVALKVTYDPGFLRFDEALDSEGEMIMLEDSWSQSCVFTSSASKCAPGAVKPGVSTHTFKVVSTSAQVTVGAGTFDTVQIERVNLDDGERKHFWYAKGIGKVRELDLESNATEELTEYQIP
jgi:hypothetical protein